MKLVSHAISKIDPNLDTDNNESRELSSPLPRQIDKKDKFYAPDCIDYSKLVSRLPQLRHIRGAKDKVQFTTFKEIGDVAQQIFELNHSFFRFVAQVHISAHYIGMRIMEEIYVTQKGKPRSKLSEILEQMEPAYRTYDDMKVIKEVVQTLIDKFVAGLMTKKDLDDHIKTYLDTFENDENTKIKMAQIIDDLLSDDEIFRSRDRNRKKKSRDQRKYEIEVSKLREVSKG